MKTILCCWWRADQTGLLHIIGSDQGSRTEHFEWSFNRIVSESMVPIKTILQAVPKCIAFLKYIKQKKWKVDDPRFIHLPTVKYYLTIPNLQFETRPEKLIGYFSRLVIEIN